jgi:chromosome segregation ATPase
MATDGESALVAFEARLPQMVIVDADVAGLSGKEVCDALKARTGDVFVPVMIVAAPQTEGDQSSVYDAGADEFITKPVDARELSARLRSLQKIYSIANRNHKLKLESTHRRLAGGDEEIVKAVSDAAAPGRRLLFQFTVDGETGFVATDGRGVVHARLGERTGREALNAMLCEPAGDYEVVEAALEPALDADLHGVLESLLARLDYWGLFNERLKPAQTILRLNPLRIAELDLLPRALAETARAFAQPRLLDDVVHAAAADWVTAARAVAELYYAGVLLREGAAAAAWCGTPLAGARAADGGEAAPNEDLQLEVLSLNAALAKAQEEATALKTKLTQATQEAWRETSARESALKVAEARAAELDTELVALKRRYASRLKDLATKAGGDVMDSVVEQLARDLQDAHMFAVSLQNAKNTFEKQAAALREEVGGLKYALEEATGTIDWLKQQHQTSAEQGGSKVQQLQNELAALKSELADSSAKRAVLQEKMLAGKRDAASAAELDEARARLAAAERSAASLAAELREKGVEIDRLRPLAVEIAKLRADLGQAVQGREAAERAARDAQAAAERAAAEVQALRDASAVPDAAQGAQLANLEQEAAALRDRVRAAEAAADEQRAAAAALAHRFELQAAEGDAVRTELAEAARLRRESAEQVVVVSERLVAAERRAAEAEARLAEQVGLAEQAQARLRTVEADQATDESHLEEEVALLKAALTDSMLTTERLQKEREADVAAAAEATKKLEAELFTLTADLGQAQSKAAYLEEQIAGAAAGDNKAAKLEKEIAFLKARLEEAAAADAALRKQAEEETAMLKAKLNTAALERKQLEQKLAAADAGKSQSDIAAYRAQIAALRGEKTALEEKLSLAMDANQRNSLLAKAQEQADLVQTLKVSLREKDAEIAALHKQAPAEGAPSAEAEAALAAARAEIDELKKKVDLLRMSVLERDEEIVDLSARLGDDGGAVVGDEVPD